MRLWRQFGLVDPSSVVQIEMCLFHDHALVLLVGIFSLVSLIGVTLLLSSFRNRTTYEAQTLETIWTIIPALLLVWLAFPRIRLLYLLDEHYDSRLILKAIGHQWYWSYEIPAIFRNSFDSYITQTNDLSLGDFRLLEVDNRPLVPYKTNILAITTSSDVIHAWALPSIGVKMDAIPGRLNSIRFNILTPGVFYGQCSEICGANHSFIPIVLESVNFKDI